METRDNPTSGGHNGLSTPDFMTARIQLAKAARLYRLVDPGTTNVSAGVQTLLLSPNLSTAGVNTLSYAVGCAIPAGVAVHAGGQTFTGMGHMATGAQWLNGPLPPTAIQDLFACMVARVNAVGAYVPIVLSGANVQDDGQTYTEFSVSEAKWEATINSDDMPSFSVWPSAYVARNCVDVLSAFKDRVCGQWPNGCNLSLGTGSCTSVPNQGYTCGGRPAVETFLRPVDLSTLYKKCP